MSKHNPYFDFLRGVAIIMVIGIHTMHSDSYDFETLEGIIGIAIRQILNCAVPLFLAISGYFIASKSFSFGIEHKNFLLKQIKKIYIPALIFSIPTLAMNFLSNTNSYSENLILFFTCGLSIYYFIALIIQYYALSPLLNKINNKWGLLISLVISFISIIVVTYLLKIAGLNLPLIIYAGSFPLWIIFFFLGMYFQMHSRKYSLTTPIILMIIGLALSITEHYYWTLNGQHGWGIKVSSFIFSIGVILFFFSDKLENNYVENKITSFINYIGGISFGIYLLHTYIIMLINKFIPLNNWFLNFIFSISLTILVIATCKKFFPKVSLKLLGFR